MLSCIVNKQMIVDRHLCFCSFLIFGSNNTHLINFNNVKIFVSFQKDLFLRYLVK